MTTKIPSNEDMLAILDSGFTSLDEQRINGLLRMKELQTTQTAMLKKEQARLEKKYSADHPRVTAITERIIYNQNLRPELDRELEKYKQNRDTGH